MASRPRRGHTFGPVVGGTGSGADGGHVDGRGARRWPQKRAAFAPRYLTSIVEEPRRSAMGHRYLGCVRVRGRGVAPAPSHTSSGPAAKSSRLLFASLALNAVSP